MSPLRSEQIVTISYLRSYISLIASPPSVFLFLRPRNQPLSAVYNQIPFPFLFFTLVSRNSASFRVNAECLLFSSSPFSSSFSSSSSTRERSKPTTDAHCEPAPFGFSLPPPSLPPFLPLSRGLFGRERTTGRSRREREGKRKEEKSNELAEAIL